MYLISNLLYYAISFVTIWFGAGLIVKSIDQISRKLRVSSFAISFFVLGILTSIPEIAVSINAVMNNDSEIFVGTLLGGTVVIFLFVIPLLAILGKGVKLNIGLDRENLISLLVMILGPSLVIIDRNVTNFEGIILILCYFISFYYIQKKEGVLEKKDRKTIFSKHFSLVDVARVAAGVGIVFVSSQFIVDKTMEFSQMLNVQPYYVSIIILSLGTNLPELSLAIRAILTGKKDIAFGDYLGSAAANTLLFGIFTILSEGEIFTFNSFLITFLFIAGGLGLFYYFSQSRKDISRKEGYVLLGVYVIFVIYEVIKGVAS